MPIPAAAASLQRAPDLRSGFVDWRQLPGRTGRYVDLPDELPAGLAAALRLRGIVQLYSHQAETLRAVDEGRDTVVVTPTASGKTLCYLLPILNEIARNPQARALFLFPTKALAQDQLDEVQGLAREAGLNVRTATYDGDTPPEERRAVRSAGHIVLTNPDMLHTGILPHHTKWLRLFENLRYVVIDEMHQYRGVFGSNVANVVRRLRRICAFYGSDPVFILCSATIGNPKELAEHLIGREVALVEKNGAPASQKTIAVYNPPVVNPELGIRQSVLKATRNLMGRVVREGVQTIAFVPSRQMVELLLTYVSEEARGRPGEVERIAGYRSGYLPLERRRIEAGLRAGEIRGVVSTSALEVGIDIGGLGASIVAGYPGTLSALWQRFGRAGRKDEPSLAVLVTGSTPLDQYIAANPDFLFDGALENALVDPDNIYVLASHLKCAAFELPFVQGDQFGRHGAEMLDILVEEGVLQVSGGRYFWMSESYPAEQVSLRQVASDNFVIIESGPKPRVIGEVDRPSAPLLIHEDAIYMHLGRQYQVEYLDWDDKKAYVRPVDVDYYTDASLAVDLKVLESFDERVLSAECGAVSEAEKLSWTQPQPVLDRQRPLTHLPAIATQPARFSRDVGTAAADGAKTPHLNPSPGGEGLTNQSSVACPHPAAPAPIAGLVLGPQSSVLVSRGEVSVTYLATIFKKVRLHTHENIGWGRISIPQEDMHTQACWLALPADFVPELSNEELQAALSGVASLVGSLAPLRLMCDPRDIHAVPQVRSPATGLPTLFVYDNVPGGVGLSERLYDLLEDVLQAARQLGSSCACEAGCPSCVGPPAGMDVDGKQCTNILLRRLLSAAAAARGDAACRA